MAIALNYVSVGCNQTPHSSDWSSSGLLAYGAGHSIALAIRDKTDNLLEKVSYLLHGHGGRVNCVRWLSTGVLVSGAADNAVRVWSCTGGMYCVDQVLVGHSAPVVCIAGIHEDSPCTTTLASGSSDSTVKVWERREDEDKFLLLQTLPLGSGFVLGLDLHCLNGHVVLAYGDSEGKVDLHVRQDGKFVKMLSLLGHEDWVRDVHFTSEGSGCLLASCSQDCYIRLWRLRREDSDTVHTDSDDDLKLTENSFSLLEGDGVERKYTVMLESVLIGHEDWVYSVRWQPLRQGSETPSLLSASMDKTMVLWTHDNESGLWMEQVRVGDVGGNSLGLYGAVFAPDGEHILAHGYHGTFHLWKKVTTDHWLAVPTISGHYGPVMDLTWEPTHGEFLLSVSADQTTRACAPWVQEDQEGEVTWREIARPQIHGYDLKCVHMLTPVLFVSGADEKVLRVFHSPKNFVENLKSVSKVDLDLEQEEFPPTASVPSLGLSNKAAFSTETPITLSAVSSSDSNLAQFTGTPFEDQLQNTLWPEIHKLYGHPYEIFCIHGSPDGKFVASACIASKQEYASILIWDTSLWRPVKTLTHHSLTVTQLAFSHSSQYLLAVSRDRTWSLWRRREEGSFVLAAKMDKSIYPHVHSRIIWSCSWTHDDKFFATGSRDKQVHFWSVSSEEHCSDKVTSFKGLQFEHAVTAVAFAPFPHKKYLLSVGLENGDIAVYSCVESDGILKYSVVATVDKVHSHTAAVKKLAWRPNPEGICLASCSVDHCVKIFSLDI